MEAARMAGTGWAVATILVGAAVAGCGNQHTAPAPPSSTSPEASAPSTSESGTVTNPAQAQPTDYSVLLIKASDIGPDITTPQPPVLNPNNAAGVAQLFTNPDNSRRIGDTILIVADPAAAAAGVDNTKNNYAGRVSGTWQPVDVGSNGVMISGTSPDNAQAVTVLLFTEGKALVNMEFDSLPDQPMDPGAVTDIGRKQDAAIKDNMPPG
jgi:hypothetical protein